MSILFAVRDLKINFSTPAGILQAVRGVSFSLHTGELLGIVGESGSGKSVTALALLNLLPGNGEVKGGDILFKNDPVLKYNKQDLRSFRGGSTGMIFQEPGRSFDPLFSVGKCFEETIKAHDPKASKDEIKRRSLSLLREVKIPEPEKRLANFPHQFSGGMLQRIMIALSLASDPAVLIADEPTTSLDVTIQARIVSLLAELKKTRSLAIIFISHDLGLIGSIADNLLVMYTGLVLEYGPAKDVLFHPLHPYSRALIETHPRPGDHYTKKMLATIPGTIPDPHRPEPGCPFAPRCRFVFDACRETLPPLTGRDSGDDTSHTYRCLIPGEK
jgi:peptide/nickel transport system permease protein